MKFTFISPLLLLALCALSFPPSSHAEPMHARVSLGRSPNEYLFTWEDFNTNISTSYVRINNKYFKGFSYLFSDDQQVNYIIRVHRAYVSDLRPNTKYVYQVGSKESGFSPKYRFKTPPNTYPLRVSIYADLGLLNHRVLETLVETPADLVIHAGDFAYNLDYKKGDYANRFFELLSEDTHLMSENIFQTCPGNHESHNNFSYYRERLATDFMHPMYYSFNIAGIHFVSINSEYYFGGTRWEIENQRAWVENDLRNVNRTITPWIIMFGHRQMYASGREERVKESEILESGLGYLLGKYGVDMYICGHQHNYERMAPILYRTFETILDPFIYKKPHFPIHIVNGAAGGPEGIEKFDFGIMPYSLVRKAIYSFGSFTIHNETHLHWEQIDEERNIIDEFWIEKVV